MLRPVQAEPLLLIADEWCPYNCAQAQQPAGYLVELLSEIFAEAGIASEYRVIPWSRAVKMVEQGAPFALLATTPAITPTLALSAAVGENRTCFFTRSDSTWHYQRIDDLQHLRLGVIQDYDSYDDGGPLDHYIASRRADEKAISSATGAYALQNNFHKLLAGRIDTLVENCAVGDYNLQHSGLRGRIKNVGRLESFKGPLHVGFNADNPQRAQWIELINRGIEQRRRTGQLSQLLARYGLHDWAPAP